MIAGAIDVHCHVDFELSEKHRKREPELEWLPKAEAMGMRGVVLKSHWWPTANVVPYILASVQTRVALWSSVALNPSTGGPDPCVVEACAELGGKVVFFPTWSARNDVERKGFSQRLQSTYRRFAAMHNRSTIFSMTGSDSIAARGRSSSVASPMSWRWAPATSRGASRWLWSKRRATSALHESSSITR